MSLIISIINLGLPSNFLGIWARVYAIAFIIALPAALMATRIAEKVVARLTT
jgi:hypothetical protein